MFLHLCDIYNDLKNFDTDAYNINKSEYSDIIDYIFNKSENYPNSNKIRKKTSTFIVWLLSSKLHGKFNDCKMDIQLEINILLFRLKSIYN